jgi:hypothetical protein
MAHAKRRRRAFAVHSARGCVLVMALLSSGRTSLLLAAEAGPRAAAAAPSDEAGAYCEYVESSAASESAVLRSPWLFSSFGTVQGSLGADEVASLPGQRALWLRLQAGVGVSPTRVYQAGLLKDRAAAECERYRARHEIVALLTPGALNRSALEARSKVLAAAMPRAEELLVESARLLEASRTTLQEHSARLLRVDGLRRALSDLRMQLAALPAEAGYAGAGTGSFERLRRSEAQKQAVEASLRRAAAVDVTLRGGYDEILGVPQALPVFGAVSLEFRPGWFWQRESEDRAARAHRAWVDSQLVGTNASMLQAREQLKAELSVAEHRLSDVSTLLADLELRLERAEQTQSRQARDYAEYIWFDVVQAKAENAFLTEQVRSLRLALGPVSEPRQ